MTRNASLLFALTVMLVLDIRPITAGDRGSLGSVVAACALLQSTLGLSAPCVSVAPAQGNDLGNAILKSPRYPTEFLVTPVAAVKGIESSAARSASAGKLWEIAWESRVRVEGLLGQHLRRTAIGLVVNSRGSRTQDQLHIHVDCLATAVQSKVANLAEEGDDGWTMLSLPPAGTQYWAKVIAAPTLAEFNVVETVASELPAAENAMARTSIAVAGASLKDGSDGFVLLVSVADTAAEPLLDHDCAGAPLKGQGGG